MNYFIYSNGRKIASDFFLELFHEENSFGIFESLRTYHGKIFRLEEHLERFRESAKTLHRDSLVKIAELKREITGTLDVYKKERLRKNPENGEKDCFIRLNLWQGKMFMMIGERRHPGLIYRTGVSLRTSPVRRTHTNAFSAQVKTTAYQNAVWASLEPSPEQTYEWVFLDQEGYVTEVRIGNLFMVRDGRLVTPPQTGILNGVTRRVVIECALQQRLRMEERPLTRHEIYNAGEAFLTNTSWEILPISQLDGRRIGEKIPGPVTSKLQQAFKKTVEKECL